MRILLICTVALLALSYGFYAPGDGAWRPPSQHDPRVGLLAIELGMDHSSVERALKQNGGSVEAARAALVAELEVNRLLGEVIREARKAPRYAPGLLGPPRLRAAALAQPPPSVDELLAIEE